MTDAMVAEYYAKVLSRFRGARPRPGKPEHWQAFCPLHKGGQERRPSVSFWRGRDGRLMFVCWACGWDTKDQILSCLGLTMSDLFPNSPERKPWEERPKPKVVEKFDYADEQGDVLYQQWRYEPKGFQLMRREGDKFVAGIGNVRRVLYRIPDLLAAPAHLPVLVAEGERKANWISSCGLPGTCNAGGTGMGWRDDYSLWLARHRPKSPFLVLPDNNDPGRRHAYLVLGSLVAHGAQSVGFLDLPGLPPGGDVLDWKATRGKDATADFLSLVASALNQQGFLIGGPLTIPPPGPPDQAAHDED